MGLSRSPRSFVMKSGGTTSAAVTRPGLELSLGLRPRHPYEVDLGRLLEPPLDVEPRLAHDEQPREGALLVDERDTRPLAGVAHDEPDDERDHERVGDERDQERRHAPERSEVLPEQQRHTPHAVSSR